MRLVFFYHFSQIENLAKFIQNFSKISWNLQYRKISQFICQKIVKIFQRKKKKNCMRQRKRDKKVQWFAFSPSLSNCTEEIFFEIGIPPTQSDSLHATQLLCFFTKGFQWDDGFLEVSMAFSLLCFSLSFFAIPKIIFCTITPSPPQSHIVLQWWKIVGG